MNEEYSKLCAVLGDITYKLTQLETKRAEVLHSLKELEAVAVRLAAKPAPPPSPITSIHGQSPSKKQTPQNPQAQGPTD